jgi:hypothetical protein
VSPGQSSSRKIATATASDNKVRIDLDGQTAIIVPATANQLGDQPFQAQQQGCSASVRPS